jgi:hypothetical protein
MKITIWRQISKICKMMHLALEDQQDPLQNLSLSTKANYKKLKTYLNRRRLLQKKGKYNHIKTIEAILQI